MTPVVEWDLVAGGGASDEERAVMTPFDDFVYLINSILLGEEPVSYSFFLYIL